MDLVMDLVMDQVMDQMDLLPSNLHPLLKKLFYKQVVFNLSNNLRLQDSWLVKQKDKFFTADLKLSRVRKSFLNQLFKEESSHNQ